MTQYLRRIDLKTGRHTNQVYGYSDTAAKEPDMMLIDEATYKECLVKLADEKRQMVQANRARVSLNNPIVMPALNKVVDAPKQDADFKVITKPVESAPVIVPDAEPAGPVDDLDTKNKLDLQNLIDAEELPVKKIGNKPELIYAIRAAREAKAKVAPEVKG